MARSLKYMTEAELVGRKVRLLVPIQTNGGKTFDVGTVMEITGKFKGLSLKRPESCPHCGCGDQHRISRVPSHEVALL